MWLGELSSECGASCLLNGASCLLNVGRVFFGASFLWGELSWGELSLGQVVRNPAVSALVGGSFRPILGLVVSTQSRFGQSP